MSAPSSWLQRQRKSDLQGLAEQVGLKDYENLKKTELEYALDEHMRANQTRLSKDSSFEAFYRRVHPTSSSVKKVTVALLVPAAATADDEKKEKKPRPRRSIKAREEIEPANSSSSSSPDVEPARSTALLARTPRAISTYVSSLELPASPSLVADQIDLQTAELRSSLSRLWASTGIAPFSAQVRESLSTVSAISTLALALEAYGLRAHLLPLRYLATIPATRVLGTSSHAVRIPDLFALLTAAFWAPVSLWLVASIALPLLGGYFFNLTLHATRRGGGRVGGQVDPVAFNVARGLCAWLVYGRGWTGGWASAGAVAGVEGSVPGGWRGVCVGAGVGGVMGLYEAVLRK